MNNEELLDLCKEKTKGLFNVSQYNLIWSYITNLKEQNERLEEYYTSLKYDNEQYEKFYKAFIKYLNDIINDYNNHNDNKYNKGVKRALERVLEDFKGMWYIYNGKDL